MSLSLMQRCPRWDACNAPVCPLYNLRTTHRRGEDICPYLLEAVKTGGPDRLRGYLEEEIANAVIDATPAAKSLTGDLSRRLQRASEQGSGAEKAAVARRSRWSNPSHG